MNQKLKFFISVLLIVSGQYVFGQTWLVPAEYSDLENPSDYNIENVKNGKGLYLKNCKSCHGDPGKNNFLPLLPHPPDVSSEQMQNNTDGELFYKIKYGQGGMPQFETTIAESDRWKLVNFIRNFSKKNIQLLVDLPPVKAKLLASNSNENNLIEIFAEYEAKKDKFEKLTNAPVIISQKRTFGNLKLGQVLTDKNGRAEFVVPENVISNEKGFINIIVSLDENYEAQGVSLDEIKAGTYIVSPKLIKRGILWSTNEYVPYWLLLSFIGAVGGVWLTIAYVVFQIIKIKKYSNQ